jgi:hypothetical protein
VSVNGALLAAIEAPHDDLRIGVFFGATLETSPTDHLMALV